LTTTLVRIPTNSLDSFWRFVGVLKAQEIEVDALFLELGLVSSASSSSSIGMWWWSSSASNSLSVLKLLSSELVEPSPSSASRYPLTVGVPVSLPVKGSVMGPLLRQLCGEL
jgi:hypothetical protein